LYAKETLTVSKKKAKKTCRVIIKKKACKKCTVRRRGGRTQNRGPRRD
jgi:hypothetical protein